MTAVLSLGSNLGDRVGHLRAGVDLLARRFPLRAVSAVYETAPVGAGDQPDFLNLVVLVESGDAEALLTAAHDAEDARGRLRSRRWGPRSLDVDVISVTGVTSTSPRLTLPHPRAHERAFVLVPWLEVEPDAVLPGHGPVRTLVRHLDATDVSRWSG